MGYLRLYKKYMQIQIQSMMQYKASFCLTAIGQFLVSFNVFLGVYFMFQRFHEVEGFTYSQVLLCFAVTLMEFSLAEAFARGFDTFSSIISNGEFDRIMVRPRNEIFQVLASKIELTRIGRMLQAVVMFTYGIAKSHVEWTWDKVLTVVFMLLGGTAVFTGIFLVYCSMIAFLSFPYALRLYLQVLLKELFEYFQILCIVCGNDDLIAFFHSQSHNCHEL